MRNRRLAILPLGPMARDPGLPAWLARELAAELGLAAEVHPAAPLRSAWSAGAPERYSADAILDDLIPPDDADQTFPGPDEWVLALTDADLAAPGLGYVFGEATVGGGWAVVGLARLDAPDLAALRLRALKVSLHEIGHLAGLDHCARAPCVMRRSRTVDDTDRKPAAFCHACAALLPSPERT